MPFIGNSPYQVAFLTDTFSGNGSTTAFTMSVAPANTSSVLVAVSGVLQDPSTYSVSGTTLTFSGAPPTGTGNISARYLGIPASGVTTTAYRTVTEFTATANQKTFTPPSYTVGFINVYRNGVLLGSADYVATNGTTVVLATGATAGDLVTVESFLVSSVLNALPNTGGTITGNLIVTGTETVPTITSASATALTLQSAGTTAVTIDTSQNVGIGTTSPTTYIPTYYKGLATQISDQVSVFESYYQAGVGQATVIKSTNAAGTGNLDLVFSGGTNQYMRIDSNGNLQLGYGGQTPTAFTAPQGMTIGSLDNVALQYYLRKGNQVEAHIGFKASTDTNLYVGTGGGAGPGGIGVYGLYQANTSTAWTAVSDERFKTDLAPITDALSKVENVRTLTGSYVYDEENNVTKKRAFLIAQDFVDALPEAVDQQDPEKLGLSYTDTIVLAFAAIKELKAENDALKARLDKAGL